MFEDRDNLNFPTPTKDSNSWYHPSLEGTSGDEEEITDVVKGNWGRKAAKGARWLRKGKLAAWGPGMEEWEADERARKRIRSLLPLDNRSPSPPILPHLRSPSPPLIAPYVALPAHHLNYTSFVMDRSVTHSFRSPMLEDLERATNGLIEGEAGMKRAFGRLWEVLSKDPDQVRPKDVVIPKQEDESEGTNAEGERERRLARAPDLAPPTQKLFIVSYPNGGSPVFDPSHFVHPDMQRENLEKSLSTLRELQDDVREYVERLEEIRESLGDFRAQRDEVWTMPTPFREMSLNGSSISAHDPGPPPIEHDIQDATDRYLLKLKSLYKLEIMILVSYNQKLKVFASWSYLKYPIPKEKRIRLVDLYYSMCTMPGMPLHVVATCSDALEILTRSKNKIGIQDIRLPWMPIFDILRHDLFLTRRQFEVSQTSYYMGMIASTVQRFFHPAATDQMLETFVPLINGTNLNSHPQSYLPMIFRLWESINSYMFDERVLHFLAQLAEMHVDPSISDPKRIDEIPDDARSENEGRPNWNKNDLGSSGLWGGIYKDVEIPLADSGSLTTGPSADNQAGFEIGRLPKPTWRIAPSSAPTPLGTPLASGMNTPRHQGGSIGDYLTAPLGKISFMSLKSYVGGSKALDSLVKLIASTESFFHPSNSGAWTADLTAFIKLAAYHASLGWHEEQRPDCKTPMYRRLTRAMKRELVKSFRTVALLAMFSEDSTTSNNISSCLKWMSLMEPDLILYPILERAVPSLEALVETQRTIAVIKALGAIAPALVSREVYYPGAKHLVPILQLLIPGIDLNDPSKTLCTTTFLIEVSQYIKFGDLTSRSITMSADVDSCTPANVDIPNGFSLTSLSEVHIDVELSDDLSLSKDEENALLRESTADFPDWIANFIRRVILLFDNLPEEAGGATEVQLVDAVTNACSQICIHLSDPLFDLVLNMIFDYASTNVRPNAVRAVHQLVECVANANPAKTLAKFVPFLHKKHRGRTRERSELNPNHLYVFNATAFRCHFPLEYGYPLSYLAVLRGAMFKENSDGKAILKHKDQFLPLLRRLRDKTFSKRGFSWSGKLLSSLLLTLTHTYPLEDKFVNREEWDSKEFRFNHHKYWGKLYTAEEVTVSWHVPDGEELDFALEVFKEIVEPTLNKLEQLLGPGTCRSLSFVRNAFSGTPTFVKEVFTKEDQQYGLETSDILNEIPEMIASIEPLSSGFAISDPQDPRARYYLSLRQRFGKLLHEASVSLRRQGEENTVDAVHALIQCIRTYFLDYGDSKDSYYVQLDRYGTELSYARQYTRQKEWPRAIFIRRARLYHAARLRWNSIERRRTPDDDKLIDDVAEWALWNYATDLAYDGIRRRCLPLIYAALEPGTEDDRMKGALWTLNSSSFEPTLAPELLKKLFGCQANEKVTPLKNKTPSVPDRRYQPSIQSAVSSVCENGINGFVEPNFHFYEVNYLRLDRALANFQAKLPFNAEEKSLVARCRERRISRILLSEERVKETVWGSAFPMGSFSDSAADVPRPRDCLGKIDALALRHLCHSVSAGASKKGRARFCSSYKYSQRAVMKAIRYIKLRTFAQGPIDLIFERNNNPLKQSMAIGEPSHDFTRNLLAQFQAPVDLLKTGSNTLLIEDISSGWLAWQDSIVAYACPHVSKSSLIPWDPESEPAISVVRDAAKDPSFWKNLSIHFSSETHSEVVSSDNVASVKSIAQLLEGESFTPLQALIEELIQNPDQNKQRGAAEFLGGLLNGKADFFFTLLQPSKSIGAKHWPMQSQKELWDWAMPLLKTTFANRIKTDTLPIWMSFLEEFHSTDYNGESSLNAVKALCFFRAFYEEQNWKFSQWVDQAVERVWAEISSEHDEASYIPVPKERPMTHLTVPRSARISASFLPSRVKSNNSANRSLRPLQPKSSYYNNSWSGVPSGSPEPAHFNQHTINMSRVGTTICRWLFQTVHDTNAISAFDYILPLMVFCNFLTAAGLISETTESVNDNDELLSRARMLLVRMCGVTPPRPLIGPILKVIFDTILNSPSWKVRVQALPLVQVFYFRQVPLLSDARITEILEVLCKCLDDEVVEVREMAATTALSNFFAVRHSPTGSHQSTTPPFANATLQFLASVP
ncbi:hypothetical protein BJY52DRAFT_1221991 [Lactarius psammicola]|nr:hypothetical protein BJY52DRAFT_1221991 [Lactarius psammicola]